MRAVQITRFGGPDVLDVVDLPDPVPGDGEQLYDVSACGVNYADTHHPRSAHQTFGGPRLAEHCITPWPGPPWRGSLEPQIHADGVSLFGRAMEERGPTGTLLLTVLFGSRDPGDEPVLFHYTGAEKLALTLTSQRLWLKSGTEVPPDLRRRLVDLAGMLVLADA